MFSLLAIFAGSFVVELSGQHHEQADPTDKASNRNGYPPAAGQPNSPVLLCLPVQEPPHVHAAAPAGELSGNAHRSLGTST